MTSGSRWEPRRGRRAANRRRPRRATTSTTLPAFEEIFEAEAMIATAHQLVTSGGPGVGPDGISPAALSRRAIAELGRVTSREILAGNFRVGPARVVRLEKPDGGWRELRIRSLPFRVAMARLHEAWSGWTESQYLPCSYGSRKDTGVDRVMIAIERAIIREGLVFIGQNDIRRAFDNVRAETALSVLRHGVTDNTLVDFLQNVLVAMAVNGVGIDQGCAIAPDILNLVLTSNLDSVLYRASQNTRWHRYADNLVVVGRSAPEVREQLQRAEALLSDLAFELKYPTETYDLRTSPIEVLGLGLEHGETGITYKIPETKWQAVEQLLHECHLEATPPRKAVSLLQGWLNAFGPYLRDDVEANSVIRRLRHLASQQGFREITEAPLYDIVRKGQARLEHIRTRVERRGPGPWADL